MAITDAINIINRCRIEQPVALAVELRKVAERHRLYAKSELSSQRAKDIAWGMMLDAIYLAQAIERDICDAPPVTDNETSRAVIAFGAACKVLGLSNREAMEIMNK